MNLAEQLSRHTARVAALKARYEDLRWHERVAVAPRIAMLEQALEHAHEAAGTGDVMTMMAALKGLAEWEE